VCIYRMVVDNNIQSLNYQLLLHCLVTLSIGCLYRECTPFSQYVITVLDSVTAGGSTIVE